MARHNARRRDPQLSLLGAMDGRAPSALGVDDVNAGVSGSESLDGGAEPGRELLEIDVFDGTKSVGTKDRGHGRRLETRVRTFTDFLKLFGARRL